MRKFYTLLLLLALYLPFLESKNNTYDDTLAQLSQELSDEEYQNTIAALSVIESFMHTAPKILQETIRHDLLSILRPTSTRSTDTPAERIQKLQRNYMPHLQPYMPMPFQYTPHYEHLAPIWKILAIMGVCSASYLIIAAFKNYHAKSDLTDTKKALRETYQLDKTIPSVIGGIAAITHIGAP